MNSKQLAEDQIIFSEWYEAHQDCEQIATPHNRAEFIFRCAMREERTRIKSELKKLDVSRYTAMSLMVKVMDIIRGEDEV